MRNLIRLLYSHESEGGAQTIDDIVDAAPIDRAGDKPAETTTEKPVEKSAETSAAWDGKNERRKRFAGEERRADAKDPGFDMGYEVEKDGKKSPVKARLSEIREAAKFYHDNRDVMKLGLGLVNQFKQSPDFAKLFDTIQSKMFKDGKIDGVFVTTTLSKLEAKEEAQKEQIDDKTDDIKDMEKDLEDLDPDSPQARILKRNISALKVTRDQLKQSMNANKSLQDKIAGIEKFNTDRTTKEKTDNQKKEEDDAIKLFDDTFKTITSKDSKDAYYIEDKDDAEDFEEKVRRSVQRLALEGKIKNDQDFQNAIREGAKVAFEKFNQRRERYVSEYLKTKKPAETDKGSSGKTVDTKGRSAETVLDDLIESVDLSQK